MSLIGQYDSDNIFAKIIRGELPCFKIYEDEDVLAFLRARLIPGEPVRARELAKVVRKELDIELQPRTIERALKKTIR